MNKSVPIVEVKGPPRQRGQQQGEGAREQAQRMLAHYRQLIPTLTRRPWEAALLQARKYLPYAEQSCPDFVEELRGIAEGANAPFDDVWALNSYEALVESRREDWGCTTLAVRQEHTADGHVFLAHNEDWASADREDVYLVRAEPDGHPSFLGMTYGPLLVNVGLNSEGIAVGIDSVYPTDCRVGVPHILASRAILQARTIGAALRACVPRLRAGGYAYTLADANGEIYTVETSATAHAFLYADEGWAVHTNHYLSPKLQALEEPGAYAGSHVRLNRARRLLRAQLGRVSAASLQSLLRDHVNHPHSICTHEDPQEPSHEQNLTLVSLIMDITAGTIWAAPGPPCEGEYGEVRL